MTNPFEKIDPAPKDKGHERVEKVGREAADGQQQHLDGKREEQALNKAGKARGGTRTWDRPSISSGEFPEQLQILPYVDDKDFSRATELTMQQVGNIENGPGNPTEKLKKEQTYFDDLAGELHKGWEWNKQNQTLVFDLTQAHGGTPESGVIALPIDNTVFGDWLAKKPLQDRTQEASLLSPELTETLKRNNGGEMPVLIAQGLDNQNYRTNATNATDAGHAQRQFKLGIEEFAAYADQNGEMPFGEPLKGGASESKMKANSYFSMTIGFETKSSKGTRDDVLNINIPDGMSVDGKSILDGQPHRAVFPINAQQGGHFHWIDATVRLVNGQMQIEIHGLSASKEKPGSASDPSWNHIEMRYGLHHQKTPQHISADDYNLLYQTHLPQDAARVQRQGYIVQRFDFKEKEYNDY